MRPEASAGMRFLTANMLKDRRGDRRYTRYLVWLLGAGVLLRQEVGHGIGSTRLRGVGVRVLRFPTWVVGLIGVHRGAARGWVRVDGTWVRVFSIHAPHVGTAGLAAQVAFYSLLAARLRQLDAAGIPWVVGGDFNDKVDQVARKLAGIGYGDGVDGFVVSPALRVVGEGSDRTGRRRGWTDHPAYWIDVVAA